MIVNENGLDQPAEEENCDTCRFSKAFGGSLRCRRFPPHSGNYFPRVDYDDWCGEFENV